MLEEALKSEEKTELDPETRLVHLFLLLGGGGGVIDPMHTVIL